jgi:hypothetical protein
MNEKSSSDPYRYRHAVASMWRGNEVVGHIYFDAQRWTRTWTSPSPKRRFSLWGRGSKPDAVRPDTVEPDAVEPDAVEEDLLEWMVVWSAPQPKGLEYVDDVSRDTLALLRELDDDKFILWAKMYDLRWIDGFAKKDVLRDVFGIDLDEIRDENNSEDSDLN